MRLDEFMLKEAITQTLGSNAWDALKETFSEFAKDNNEEIARFLGFWKHEQQYEKMGKEDSDWDERSRVRDRIFDVGTSPLHRLTPDDQFRKDLVQELKSNIEMSLQDVVRDHIENKLGEIKPIPLAVWHSGEIDYEKYHLYQAEHIIVSLDISTERNSGGYFAEMPSEKEFTTAYTQAEIESWYQALSLGIKVYANADSLWEAFIGAYDIHLHDKYMGEWEREYERPLDEFIERVGDTLVHEAVHLEQHLRLTLAKDRDRKNGNFKYARGITNLTMLPNPKTGQPRHQNADGKMVKHGRRGTYDNLMSVPQHVDSDFDERWAAYVGTLAEIEAHAAGYAASLIMRGLKDTYGIRDKSRRVNEIVDSLIDDLRYGYTPETGSFYTYKTRVKNQIERINSGEISLGNSPLAFERVWKRFLKKVTQHLLAHKTHFKRETWDDSPKHPVRNLPADH